MNSNCESRRIASNTLMLFVRMFVLMLASLYAVRLLINGLGDNDYGIFNTVAGVVTTTAFLSSILAFSVQRFFSVAIGEKDARKSKDVFTASLNIAVGASLVIFLFLETVGIWFVTNWLTIPPDRMDATLLTFQFSILTFLMTFLQVPFLGAIYANEDMGVYSVVSTIDALGRVGAAWMITRVSIDKLVGYSFILFILSVIVFACYAVVAIRRYPECRYTRVSDKSIYRQLMSFSGWYAFGSLANIGLNQGNVILLNIFFGPMANAAFGVATQIQNAFNSLSNSMVLPFRPPMIKAYAEGDYETAHKFFTVNNKVIYYLMLAVSLPIIIEMPTILKLWLGHYSEMTLRFSQLMVVCVLFISLHNPISIIIHATGKVKQYHVPVESFILMSCPATLLLFKMGYPAESIFYAMLLLVILAHMMRIVCLKRYFAQFSLSYYILRFLVPAGIATVICSIIAFGLHNILSGDITRLVAELLIIPCCVILMAYIIGISAVERRELNIFVIQTIKHRRKQ